MTHEEIAEQLYNELHFYLAEVGGRKTRERKMFKTLEQAKSWRDIKLKERIVGK